MTAFPTSNLDELLSDQWPSISIYMPTHRTDGKAHQDNILLKKLLRKAEDLLLANGMRAPEIEELVKRARAQVEDPLFWRDRADGLVLFVSPTLFHFYHLPLNFEELVVVAHHFHVRPLLPLQGSDELFYILALSRNHVRLLQATQYSIIDVKLEGLPQNLEQALGHELREKQSGFRPVPASVGGGGRQAIFYGQGAGPDELRDELSRYFHVVDAALHSRLKDEKAPLVLASVNHLIPIYQEVNTYPHLLGESIKGNPEKKSLEDLHSRGWGIVQPQFKRAEEGNLARYYQLAGTGLTSCDLEQILRAAYEGRIEALFVDSRMERWGSFDSLTGTILLHPLAGQDGDELLNLAAIKTLLNRGKVFSIPSATMPEGSAIAAILRHQ